MILVDANLLLYAYDAGSEHHERARAWWEEVLSSPSPIRVAWITLVAFIRIGTHPRVFIQPLSIEEAIGHVSAWMARPMFGALEPGDGHWEIYARLLKESQSGANLAPDAHVAALALEHGAALATTDRDFQRFPGLKTLNPLNPTRPLP
ncbi:MAG: type II toxin-antitoxin system VapC family toxin [Nitrospirae bacterium]|nr:type II toxin-antitoxin system VapC family toxin [Nitrospirota bacterium]